MPSQSVYDSLAVQAQTHRHSFQGCLYETIGRLHVLDEVSTETENSNASLDSVKGKINDL